MKILTFLTCLLFTNLLLAQDIIHFKNGDNLRGKVIEDSKQSVKIKLQEDSTQLRVLERTLISSVELNAYDAKTYKAPIIQIPTQTKLVTESQIKRTEEYVLIVATAKFLSTKVSIVLDYGQEKDFFQDNRVKNEEGKVASFNSVIDALNYMNGQGWEFMNAYPITTSSGNVYHYLMKRKI
ncbi:MAG: hypothetical protein EOO43_06630 [Flavobacterium sp.]|nr:MAG: hypothetical protein EOO43_06630 [Flavobacterium sp.]